MKGKPIPVIFSITISLFTACNSGQGNGNREIPTAKVSKDSFYQAQIVWRLEKDSQYLNASKFIWGAAPGNEVDTQIINWAEHSNRPGEASYYLTADQGEQYKLSPQDKFIWINSSSSLVINYKHPNIHSFDFYGEGSLASTKDSLRVSLTADSLRIAGKAGTEVHVRDYIDERYIVISLRKGRAKINSYFKGNPLKDVLDNPGDQLWIDRKSLGIKKETANIIDIPGWDNSDRFRFSNADVYTMFGTFKRWYNLSVFYDKSVADISFVGGIFYKMPIDSLFKFFDVNGIKCSRRGDTVWVSRK